MTDFQRVVFVIQFYCLEDELIDLSSIDVESCAEDVLISSPLGDRFSISTSDDSEYFVSGDFSLHDFDDFCAILRGTPLYESLSIGFEAFPSGRQLVSWSELRQELLSLRSQPLEASSRWPRLNQDPISISLEYAQPSGSRMFAKLSREDGIEFLNILRDSASARQEIASFLNFFELEIASYQSGKSSRLLDTWFTTELLLTQAELELEADPQNPVFLKPRLMLDNFSWHQAEAHVGKLIEADRHFRDANCFWINPLPKNPFRQGSNWDFNYRDAADESERRGGTGVEFDHLNFVMTMWYLYQFAEAELVDSGESIDVAGFLQVNLHELEGLLDILTNSKYALYLDGHIPIPSSLHDFLLQLPLPENAEAIWTSYLSLIGRLADD